MTNQLTAKLSPDETNAAKDIARQLGMQPAQALAEMAVATALRRKWNGKFDKVEAWKIWQRLGLACTEIRVFPTMHLTGALVVKETDTDGPTILVLDRGAPKYVLAGWITGKTAKQEKYWNAAQHSFLIPQDNLRQCWELQRERSTGKRLNRNDPADDFAGHGRWPQMRDADDGGHPSHFGNVVTASYETPCLRCQTMIPRGTLVGGNLQTGSIHGDPAECGYYKKKRAG